MFHRYFRFQSFKSFEKLKARKCNFNESGMFEVDAGQRQYSQVLKTRTAGERILQRAIPSFAI
jgi:hypothetical protein